LRCRFLDAVAGRRRREAGGFADATESAPPLLGDDVWTGAGQADSDGPGESGSRQLTHRGANADELTRQMRRVIGGALATCGQVICVRPN